MVCCPKLASDAVVSTPSASAPLQPAAHPEMSLVPAGSWTVGEDRAFANPDDREGPVRQVSLPAYLLDKTAVTNRDFARFAAATGYRTEAERLGWSFVFAAQVHPAAKMLSGTDAAAPDWWAPVRGACWHSPDGRPAQPGAIADHPVVHVSWNDALAYADFAGKRLPTETEWEVAARGGLHRAIYAWGDDLMPNGQHMCNIWQGRFPVHNSGEDGYLSTAPARSFPPNGFGLYNMLGNAWEWTSSPWSADATGLMAMRGGSYLCHASYCNRYRVSARTSNAPHATSSHLSFRCAADIRH